MPPHFWGMPSRAGRSTTSGSTASGSLGRPACALQEAEEAPPGHRSAPRGLCVPSGPTWCGPWTSSSTPPGPPTLKLLNVVDEYSRECLAIDVARSIDADGVVATLERLAADRGAPTYVRFDHGPEFIAYAVADWCRFNGTDTVFIDPGSPWQNGWIECFNGRMRDEHLNGQLFDSLLEAQVFIEDWRIDYNNNRPHSSHGWLTRASSSRPGSPKPTSTRIAAGPLIGDPLTRRRPDRLGGTGGRVCRRTHRSVHSGLRSARRGLRIINGGIHRPGVVVVAEDHDAFAPKRSQVAPSRACARVPPYAVGIPSGPDRRTVCV